MKKVVLPIVIIFSLSILSCKKENETTCWQIIDALGNDLQLECDKSEAEIKAKYENCRYYKSTDPKFCWECKTGSSAYTGNYCLSEKIIRCYETKFSMTCRKK